MFLGIIMVQDGAGLGVFRWVVREISGREGGGGREGWLMRQNNNRNIFW